MATRQHLVQTAQHFKNLLGNRMFRTVERMDFTTKLRETSGENNRIKDNVAAELSELLADHGVRCFPKLTDTERGDDTIRLYHSGSLLTTLIELIQYPSQEGDKQLGQVVSKIKGQWAWAESTGPAALVEDREQ